MSSRIRSLTYNLILLLRVVRWYNLGLLVLSQYLLARFVFQSHLDILDFLLHPKLHLLIFATSFAVAGAFIINSFYDVDKDLVNHSRQVVFNRLLGQDFLLNVYAGLNVISLFLALLASTKVFVFCAVLIFLFWFYSHKLQKMPLLREVSASLLATAPLFAVWLHYATYHFGVLLYMGSLLVLGFTREVVKDLEGNKGNIIFGYTTVVVAAGSVFTRRWLVAINLLLTSAWLVGFLTFIPRLEYFSAVSGFSIITSLLVSFICLFPSETERSAVYSIADTLLKVAIVIHLLSLPASGFIG
ncbi:MAG: UbiA family prenyltransferase [Bacteroidetes bacterium]|nr:UbiA family prenyltransferase [Bacteroidota bacterium]